MSTNSEWIEKNTEQINKIAEVLENASLIAKEGGTIVTIDDVPQKQWEADFVEQERLKTINLLPFPYTDGVKTTNGITFTPNSDGSITINGTATANAYFTVSSNFNLKTGTYHNSFVDGNRNPLSNDKFVMEIYSPKGLFVTQNFGGDQTKDVPNIVNGYLSIIIKSGATVNGTYYPQLEKGNVATPFQPYNGEITHNGDSPVVFAESERLKTKNLLCFKNYTLNQFGLDIVINAEEQTVTINGTVTDTFDFSTGIPNIFPIKNYAGKQITISANVISGSTSGNIDFFISPSDDPWYSGYYGTQVSAIPNIEKTEKTFTVSTDKPLDNFRFYTLAGVVVNNLVIKFQVEEYNKATDWEYPYGAILHKIDIVPDVLYDIDEKPIIGGVPYNNGINIDTEVYEDFSKYREVIIYSERGGTVLRTVANVNKISETSYSTVGIDYGFNYLIIHSFIITKEKLAFTDGGYKYVSWTDVIKPEDSSSSNRIIRIEGVK